ncbi:MAG TPA: phospholipid carrier-dependent glycosyltransferase, partial [Polyangia bacterium]|nr:phospholipid carrier-dependent glycosyltransferase [Polyangia bacterium]
ITFKSTRAALLAGAFVAADGFFIAYSRAALLDGMIVAFALAGVSTIIVAEKFWQVLVAAVLVGCAASFKLNGVTFVAVAALVCVVRPRLRRWTPVLLLVSLFVFYAQSAFALVFTGGSGTVQAVIAENLKLARHHLSYTVVHPWSSHWYTWFLPLRPLALWRDFDPTDNALRTLVTLGNPLLWWASTLAVLAIIWVLVQMGPRRLWRRTQGLPELAPAPPLGTGLLADVLAVQDRALPLLWILGAWTAPLAFWVPSLRDAYLYHYLPSYTFALVLLAGLVDRLYSRRRLATFVAIILVAEISFFYAPIWGELPISQEALNVRLFIPAWR